MAAVNQQTVQQDASIQVEGIQDENAVASVLSRLIAEAASREIVRAQAVPAPQHR